MLLLAIIEKIAVNLPCSALFRITQVCSDLRNMCLQERFWKSKFVRKNLPFPTPSMVWEDTLSCINIYKRCKKIYPQILEKINKKHNILCCINLVDASSPMLFPERIRDRVLPFFKAACKAKEEEEEENKDKAERWIHNAGDWLEEGFTLWFSLYVMLDGTLRINRNADDTKVCFTEKLSRAETELFLLQLIVLNGSNQCS
ncbi:F-box domain [Cedratvirus A11]|uniref:F-box domain n=1 Tax=Cedratvirus A11 TaxID=1903266 RepID=A0A1M7XUL6_9VIRU|nr:F-box domain [Cedratvirus A11]SHO33379.1 F-box domain [Cedratvirus A11]